VLCLLFVRRPDQVWIAYSVTIAHAVCTAFFEPAQQATYPNLVPAEDLVLAGTLWLAAGFLAVANAAGSTLCTVDPRALMAACGLVALVPAAFWASVQAAFRRAEPRDTAAA